MKFIENQYALNSGHCEERSDAAIQRSLVEKGPGLLRFARNGGIKLNVFGILVLVFSALLLSACGEDKAPELSVLYSTDVTVVQGNEVIFDRAAIGTVEKVAGDGDGSRVTLSISADKLAMLHEGSAAMMTSFGGSPVVEIYDRGSGDALSDGDELIALNDSLEYLAWQTGKSVDSAQSSLIELTESVQSYFQGEEWASKRREVEQRLEQLGVNAEQTMQQMQDDYDAMVKELESKTEESAELAQKHYDQLSENVEKQLKLLMENGEEALADTMQQFSETAEALMEKYSAENRK